MENKLNVSVILPINSSKNKNFEEYFSSCILSIKKQTTEIDELVIVHSDEESLKLIVTNFDYSGLTVNLVENKGDVDFSTQVNLGIEKAKNEWISLLEFDDEYASIWFKNVKRYIKAYPNVSGFLPLVIDVDDKGVFAGFTNEATFAANMNTEIGYLTNEVLLNYQNFQTSGIVIKKSVFNDFGGFKKSMKLTFVYELLLRLSHNSVDIMTIPRIGYKHINMREGSIFWNYKFGENKITEDEVAFWISTAKKEYFFIEDRNINYQPMDV
jgi:glycosyltransferase involved in cell wall biosynthesis|tara:strand:- start:10854 stop:11660 length:807 start_codon:yes stop_codon:yes gene_type:complete